MAEKSGFIPEESVTESWGDLGKTLLPPEEELWRFGGEMFAKFESGDVHYQDAFGRTEKERDFPEEGSAGHATAPRRYVRLWVLDALQDVLHAKAHLPCVRRGPSAASANEISCCMNAIANVLGLSAGKGLDDSPA